MSETSIPALLKQLPESVATLEIANPASGKRIYDLPQLTAGEVFAAVARARVAQQEWAALGAAERGKRLLALHDAMFAHESQLLDLLQLETGKSRAHAFEEFAGAVSAARYYGKIAPKQLKRKRTNSGVPLLTSTWVDHIPIGVVGIVTPWNYPLALTMLDVSPALAAGNAVVQKIDNQAALTALFVRKLAADVGISEDVWIIVTGDGAEVGNALTDSVDYIAFTGSTATGRSVAQRAAARLIGCSLELGGKNPMIVLPSADPKKAAELAIAGAFGSAGQLCVSIERVYVPHSQLDEFLSELAARVTALTVGRSNEFDFDIGTLTGKNQLQRVSNFVSDALSRGAKLIAGGSALPEVGPYFYSPTVITNTPDDALLFKQEVFGPLISVTGYNEVSEAIRAANDTEFGLNASVIGEPSEALRVASQLHAGSVNINEGYRASFASMESPMGGMKQSGIGRRNGIGGLLRFTEIRTIGMAASGFKLPTRASHYVRMAPLMRTLLKLLRRF